MSQGYERRAGEPPHWCPLPSWWRRWRDGIREGAIWRCSCGRRYEFRPVELVYRGVHRVGQTRAPWWEILPGTFPPPMPAPPIPKSRPS